MGPHDLHNASRLFFSHPQRRGFDRDIEAQRDGALIVFPEAQSYERSFFCSAWLYRVLPRGTCGAPWVIAPRRGELKRAPVSNLALCQVVGMREDGRSSRIFRGWRHARFSSTLVAPWLAHLGVHRPCWRAHSLPSSYMGPALLLFLWLHLSSLPACVSVGSPALYCIVFTAVLLTCGVYSYEIQLTLSQCKSSPVC